MEDALPIKVWSRGRKSVGKPTGNTDVCPMEGCRGQIIEVKWPNGKTTWPCSKGMDWSAKGRVATIV